MYYIYSCKRISRIHYWIPSNYWMMSWFSEMLEMELRWYFLFEFPFCHIILFHHPYALFLFISLLVFHSVLPKTPRKIGSFDLFQPTNKRLDFNDSLIQSSEQNHISVNGDDSFTINLTFDTCESTSTIKREIKFKTVNNNNFE